MTTHTGTTNGTIQLLPESGDLVSDIEDGSDAICAMCPHPSASHDQIARRFCAASVNATDRHRGCVCGSK
ncbi:MAG: RGCVC family protein [Kibdelosporangium sp.]